MAFFTKRPVTIEAFLWDGGPLPADAPGWLRDALAAGSLWFSRDRMQIETLEGTMSAAEGDWIVQGVQGEIYPIKPDVFAQTYAPAGAPAVTSQPAA